MDDTPCICTGLRGAALTVTRLYDDALAPTGLKVTMYRLLRRVENHPGANITDLASAVGLDRSTLGRNLRVLAREGLVSFGAGDDDRARSVTLTDEGARRLAAAEPAWRSAQDRMRKLLGPDAEAFLSTIHSVSHINAEPQS